MNIWGLSHAPLFESEKITKKVKLIITERADINYLCYRYTPFPFTFLDTPKKHDSLEIHCVGSSWVDGESALRMDALDMFSQC